MRIPIAAKAFTNGLQSMAFSSQVSKGRLITGEGIIDPFHDDESRIFTSLAFRRLADKAQVFSSPASPHTLTRLSHTTEVVAFAGTVAQILGLNMFLCRAIALGHDIGHAPYGHLGESFISDTTGRDFKHEVFSVVLAQEIEAMNLSFEVLEGILLHSRKEKEITISDSLPPEYNVAMLADKITYLFSDIEDAIRHGYLETNSLPKSLQLLGENKREQVENCLVALLKESCEEQMISFTRSETAKIFREIRDWMYANFYLTLRKDVQRVSLRLTYDFLKTDEAFIGLDPVLLLALMTDREVDMIGQMSFGFQKPIASDIRNFGITEIIPLLKGKSIDWTDPKLT